VLRNRLYARGTAVIEDGPLEVATGSAPMLRQLTSLGLTEETSIGILRVLLRVGARPVEVGPSDL
jgi:Fe2+ transport system protein FeoA